MTSVSTWKTLNNIETLHQLVEDSNEKPVAIFKHSTTCGISAAAKHRLESEYDQIEGDVSFYYLDLLAHRDISNAVAKKLNVIHQSPQVIVLKDEEVVHTSSHHSISAGKIATAIE